MQEAMKETMKEAMEESWVVLHACVDLGRHFPIAYHIVAIVRVDLSRNVCVSIVGTLVELEPVTCW
jgi:hypothetical protein